MAGIYNGYGVLCKVGYKLATRRSADWEQHYSHLENPGSQLARVPDEWNKYRL
jgi:hypothetical protein